MGLVVPGEDLTGNPPAVTHLIALFPRPLTVNPAPTQFRISAWTLAAIALLTLTAVAPTIWSIRGRRTRPTIETPRSHLKS